MSSGDEGTLAYHGMSALAPEDPAAIADRSSVASASGERTLPAILQRGGLEVPVWLSGLFVSLIIDERGTVVAASPSAMSLTGGPLSGQPATTLVPRRQAAALRAVLAAAGEDWTQRSLSLLVSQIDESQVFRCFIRRVGAHVVLVAEPAVDIRTLALDGLLDIAQALASERQRLGAEQADLLSRAVTDELTGLWNRRGLTERGEQQVVEAHQSGRPLSVAFVDIDHFKAVNDDLGHAEGDHALRRFAQRMRDQARAADVVGRWGGEEFVVLMVGSALAGGTQWANRVREAVYSDPIRSDARVVTASFGVAELRPGETYEELLARADRALYQAKRAGRDRVVAAR